MENLPSDILSSIFLLLELKDYASIARCCKELSHNLKREIIWRYQCDKHKVLLAEPGRESLRKAVSNEWFILDNQNNENQSSDSLLPLIDGKYIAIANGLEKTIISQGSTGGVYLYGSDFNGLRYSFTITPAKRYADFEFGLLTDAIDPYKKVYWYNRKAVRLNFYRSRLSCGFEYITHLNPTGKIDVKLDRDKNELTVQVDREIVYQSIYKLPAARPYIILHKGIIKIL